VNTRDVEARVREVRDMAERGDFEMAHSLEDQLYADVLEAIADGYADTAALASEALLTKEIEFDRWFA
jgi:hypothetical protein